MNFEQKKRQITCRCLAGAPERVAEYIKEDSMVLGAELVKNAFWGALPSGLPYCAAGIVTLVAEICGSVAYAQGGRIGHLADSAIGVMGGEMGGPADFHHVDEAFRAELHEMIDAAMDRAMSFHQDPDTKAAFKAFDEAQRKQRKQRDNEA